jgi:hypothetical protein
VVVIENEAEGGGFSKSMRWRVSNVLWWAYELRMHTQHRGLKDIQKNVQNVPTI